jgi:hypothetical protein
VFLWFEYASSQQWKLEAVTKMVSSATQPRMTRSAEPDLRARHDIIIKRDLITQIKFLCQGEIPCGIKRKTFNRLFASYAVD